MLLGLVVYIWDKIFNHVGNLETQKVNKLMNLLMVDFWRLLKSKTQLVFTVILSALSLFGWYNLGWAFGLLFLFLTVIVALMMMIYKELSSQQDKDRFVVLLLSFIMVIIFWGAFEQAGGLMNLYTDAKTDRMLGWQVPTVMFQSLNAGFIILLQLV
jgi:POT family proton-dependent oligopeptide transporter